MKFAGRVLIFRRHGISNPYNPGELVPGDWADAETRVLEGAALLSLGAEVGALRDGDRVGAVVRWTLHVDDPVSDVRKGDGVARSLSAVAPEFVVDTLPVADMNPFTGWQPQLEVPLIEGVG